MEAKSTAVPTKVEMNSPKKSKWEQMKRMKLLYVMLLLPADHVIYL